MKQLEDIKKEWEAYNEEFDNSECMDVMKHVNIAEYVGMFISEVKFLQKENNDLKFALESCKYHAESIIEAEYGETFDAYDIVDEVNDILGN